MTWTAFAILAMFSIISANFQKSAMLMIGCRGVRDLVRGAEEGGRDINKVVGNSLVGKLPSL